MRFKILSIIYLFFIVCLQAQQSDSLTRKKIQNELETIRQFRQKDSMRIAILLNEIQEILHNENNQNRNLLSSPTDSVTILKRKKEIENLRVKMRGKPIVFEKDTLYYLYSSYGPYDVDTRVKYIEDKLKEIYEDPFFYRRLYQSKAFG